MQIYYFFASIIDTIHYVYELLCACSFGITCGTTPTLITHTCAYFVRMQKITTSAPPQQRGAVRSLKEIAEGSFAAAGKMMGEDLRGFVRVQPILSACIYQPELLF